jgi:uncharacterized protein YcfL
MKKIFFACAAFVSLAACSSTPERKPWEQTLVVEPHVYGMSRGQVISAILDCEETDTRPVLIYGKRTINGHPTEIVTEVTCAPTRRARR